MYMLPSTISLAVAARSVIWPNDSDTYRARSEASAPYYVHSIRRVPLKLRDSQIVGDGVAILVYERA
jgi:hypothetical protein